MKPTITYCFAGIVAAAAITASSHAAIVVENIATQQDTLAAGSTSYTFTNFDMSGGNFLAVLFSGERSGSGADASDVDVTYGTVGVSNGSPLDTVENEGPQIASINYWLNPSITSGDVVVTLPTGYRGGVTVISLSGVGGLQDADTFGENLGTAAWNETLAGTTGGMILGAAVDNTFGTTNQPTFSGGYINTLTLSLPPAFATGGSAGVVHGYGIIGADGDFTQTFSPASGGGNSSRNAGAYLTLTAIPEPSAALFGGLGLLALIRRRR